MTDSSNQSRVRRGALLLPDHAAIVRKAVKATTRYYGIRLQDLGPTESWIREAMRSETPMTIKTAEILLAQIQKPRPELVGKKIPQGRSQEAAFEEVLRQQQAQPDASATVAIDPTTQYLGYSFFASLILSRYTAPYPGSAFFVLPGASQSIAEFIVSELPLGTLGVARRKQIVESLSAIFETAEVPLATDLGKRVEPRLSVLAIVNTLTLIAEAQESIGVGEIDLSHVVEATEAVLASEVARANSLAVPRSKKPPKKRTVVLPKVKNLK